MIHVSAICFRQDAVEKADHLCLLVSDKSANVDVGGSFTKRLHRANGLSAFDDRY